MTKTIRTLSMCCAICAAAMLTGCAADEIPTDDAAALTEALELENGGFDDSDAEPMFGLEAELAAAGLDEEPVAVEDPILINGPDGVPPEGVEAATVLVLWGQIRVDPDQEAPRRWDGQISTTGGALVVRRTLRFEAETDALLPRTERESVAFTSVTRPHRDGLLLDVVLAPEATVPQDLVVSLDGLDDIVIAGADLVAGYHELVPVDDTGNAVLIASVPRGPCVDGMLVGVWNRVVGDRLGTFHGRWQGAEGELQGHLRGIYGVNRAGAPVFYGKYISTDGAFQGFLRGEYGDGRFTGRWVDRDGETIGELAGRYSDDLGRDLPGDGVFAGGWSESCDL
jgi:hypothetical protein